MLLKAVILESTLRLYSAAEPFKPFDRKTSAFLPEYEQLVWELRKQNEKYNLVGRLALGYTLLVGEGNLSFAVSLARTRPINPRKLTATTFETEKELSSQAKANARTLQTLGVQVCFGVDARNLKDTFPGARFDNIVFLFPNVASRDPVRGRNPNHELVRRFLLSAAGNLASRGKVMISAVNSPYYLGVFDFQGAARKTGYRTPDVYAFDPFEFAGYEHTMTHREESAIDKKVDCSLWVFQPKQPVAAAIEGHCSRVRRQCKRNANGARQRPRSDINTRSSL